MRQTMIRDGAHSVIGLQLSTSDMETLLLWKAAG